MHDANAPVPPLPKEVQAFLKEHGLPENTLENIVTSFLAMRNNVPHLSEEDIDKIAGKVTDAVEERLERRLRNEPDKKKWKDQARAAIRDLVIGLLGSGLYSLIVYLSTEVLHLDGAGNQPRTDSRKKAIQSKLLQGVNSEDIKDLEANFFLSQRFGTEFRRRWQAQIALLSPFKETIESSEEEGRRAGWSVQKRLSGNPIEAEWIEDVLFGTMTDYVSELLLQKSKLSEA